MSAAALKIIITILLLLTLASLVTSGVFLFGDHGKPGSRHTFYWLCVRVTLATLLVLTIGYGFVSGTLKSRAPWENVSTSSPEGPVK